MIKKTLFSVLGLFFLVNFSFSEDLPEFPMEAKYKNSIEYRWDNKEVYKSKTLSNAEDLKNWQHQDFGKLILSSDRKYQGESSLKLTSPTKGEEPGPTKGRPFGAASVTYQVNRENWSDWNRISFWVYPDLDGFRTVSLSLVFHNDGEEKVPGPYDRNGLNYVILENHKWNRVDWEIAHLGRKAVTGIELRYRLQGNEPIATDTVAYYFDKFELQKVKPDYYEGWEVAPNRIAYSHIGYAREFSKIALASNISAKEFSLLTAKDNLEVYKDKIDRRKTPIGSFQVMDFTDFDEPGKYILKAGEHTTQPFRIDDFKKLYNETIVKTNNLFYTLRCGYKVPGIHNDCHKDAYAKHDTLKTIVNGGWHDAGDLSQSSRNTAEAAYSLFRMGENLNDTDPALSDRLIQEGEWGLKWLLKTRFGDGYRANWITIDFWTDGIIGNVDDPNTRARNDAYHNFKASKAEAIGGKLLRDKDSLTARYAIKVAEEDWKFAQQNIRDLNLNLAAAGLNTSLVLYDITKNQKYKDAALEYGDYIVDCQAKNNIVEDKFSKGFFYESNEKEVILHFSHIGQEQAPITGLVGLCKTFTEHRNLNEWEETLRLYTNYYRKVTQYTDPYHMPPAGIYDLEKAEDEVEEEQIKNGVKLSNRYYLRRFPVWKTFRGNDGVILSQAKALATAGEYFDDQEILELAYKQLQWNLGLNPFCQSLMYGTGYDFAPQYSAMCGDIVGGLPVGVQTHFNRDIPYYPTENCYNWKEIWVHPSSRWLSILSSFID